MGEKNVISGKLGPLFNFTYWLGIKHPNLHHWTAQKCYYMGSNIEGQKVFLRAEPFLGCHSHVTIHHKRAVRLALIIWGFKRGFL